MVRPVTPFSWQMQSYWRSTNKNVDEITSECLGRVAEKARLVSFVSVPRTTANLEMFLCCRKDRTWTTCEQKWPRKKENDQVGLFSSSPKVWGMPPTSLARVPGSNQETETASQCRLSATIIGPLAIPSGKVASRLEGALDVNPVA